jgi:tetratricopeptide (TPR) repeat protein
VRDHHDAAIEAIERAHRLSPFDPFTFFYAANIALAHLAARRFELAIEWADRALHDQPRLGAAMRVKVVANAHRPARRGTRRTPAILKAVVTDPAQASFVTRHMRER